MPRRTIQTHEIEKVWSRKMREDEKFNSQIFKAPIRPQRGHWLVNLCHSVPLSTLFISYPRICQAEKSANDLLYYKMGLTCRFNCVELCQSNNFTDRSYFSGGGLLDNNTRAVWVEHFFWNLDKFPAGDQIIARRWNKDAFWKRMQHIIIRTITCCIRVWRFCC